MNSWVRFNPTEPEIWDAVNLPSTKEVMETPQLFQADYEFAAEHGGSFVCKIISRLPTGVSGYRWIIDTKVHMLKLGWYPGIPGWHVDFAPNWTGIVNWDR